MARYLVLSCVVLSGCAEFPFPGLTPEATPAVVPVEEVQEPVADLPPPPPPAARTVEEFDTTTAEDRAAAVETPVASGAQLLGTTNVALGDVADPGIWIKTGLVSEAVAGRVENPANGQSVTLELRPSGGPASGGSQLSLAAMRLLDIPLTELVDVQVFAGG